MGICGTPVLVYGPVGKHKCGIGRMTGVNEKDRPQEYIAVVAGKYRDTVDTPAQAVDWLVRTAQLPRGSARTFVRAGLAAWDAEHNPPPPRPQPELKMELGLTRRQAMILHMLLSMAVDDPGNLNDYFENDDAFGHGDAIVAKSPSGVEYKGPKVTPLELDNLSTIFTGLE